MSAESPGHYVKRDVAFLRKHANQRTDGRWACKKTGVIMRFGVVPRSIWMVLNGVRLPGGGGEVRYVGHIWCPRCQPKFKLPARGTPIYEDELVGVGPYAR